MIQQALTSVHARFSCSYLSGTNPRVTSQTSRALMKSAATEQNNPSGGHDDAAALAGNVGRSTGRGTVSGWMGGA